MLDFFQYLVLNDETGALGKARHVVLRVFALQDGAGQVTVFPGGLTRVALAGRRITGNSSGAPGKPTWVVS